ncbi:MAG: hypothetical protein A2284_11420 [Deltaproteobacteria bacterium RIFOXYA12_FULL_61_11]|nr:MAG: hypothetical protein A2284_11420 [Deltaproteobacteria bacterium RIFOXYA12_FULL_61_11]
MSMTRCFAILLFLLPSLALAVSFSLIVEERGHDFPSNAPTSTKKTYLYQDDQVRVHEAATDRLELLDRGKARYLAWSERDRTYVEYPLQQILGTFSEPFAYLASAKSTFQVDPTAEVPCGTWTCRRALISFEDRSLSIELLLAPIAGLSSKDFLTFFELLGRIGTFGKHTEELGRQTGFPVKITATYQRSTGERKPLSMIFTVLEAKVAPPIPADAFEVPKGFSPLHPATATEAVPLKNRDPR